MKKIIEENHGLIRAIIKKITGTYNDDLEQEVYIKTWRYLPQYQESGKLKQWLSAIAASVCKDYFKSSAYRQKISEVTEEEVLQNKSVAASQEKIIDARKRQKIILKAVDGLPAKMRKVIILHEFEDLTIEQIAMKSGEPVGTIKSRLYNARKILAEKLNFLQGE